MSFPRTILRSAVILVCMLNLVSLQPLQFSVREEETASTGDFRQDKSQPSLSKSTLDNLKRLRNDAVKAIDNIVSTFKQQSESSFFSCPCIWPGYCHPITEAPRKEVMVFSVANNSSHWENYDWTRITTVVMFNYYNPHLMCLAHKHGARVVAKVSFPLANVTNSTDTGLFVKNVINMVKNYHLDGVNIDIEDPVDKSDFKTINAFTAFVKTLVTGLKTVNKNYQISFDAAWSPECIDKRCYDLFEISKIVDYLFVMAYDEQSQMTDKQCIAKANSGFNKTVTGVLQYIQKNIPRNKLILGVPWYGYDYPCLKLDKNDTCTIKKVPFRGVDCSDAAGKQRSFADISEVLKTQHLIRRWDNDTGSPFFNYQDSKGTFHQVWFDDIQSLSMKYAFAAKVGLGGVGMWNADLLNYTDAAEAVFKSMWNALPKFP